MIQNIVLIQDSNYVQQVIRSRVQDTLLKTVSGFCLLWLIKVLSGCRGGGFNQVWPTVSEFRCEGRGRTVGDSGTF